jgi:hypothetical protein
MERLSTDAWCNDSRQNIRPDAINPKVKILIMKKFLYLIKQTLIGTSLITLGVVQTSSLTYAVGGSDSFYSANQIEFFNPSDKACVTPSTTAGFGQVSSNELIKTAVQGAEKFKADYQKAGKDNDVPWELLAAIHYRESGYSDSNPSNGQGLFQFYAERNSGNYPTGPVSRENFLSQLNKLAQSLKGDYSNGEPSLKSVSLRYSGSDPKKVKDVAFSYNGRASVYIQQAKSLGFNPDTEGYEGSPYVMNLFDDKRDPAKSPTTWGQIKSDGGGIEYPATNQIGIYTLYAALGGGTSSASGSGSCGAPSGSSGSKVIDIAVQELQKKTSGCMSGSAGQCATYTETHQEAWCADFVSWVYKESGRPFTAQGGGWRIPAVSALKDWFVGNGTYFKVGDSTQPQPGDVIIFSDPGNPFSHTGLVYQVTGDKFTTIEGNLNDAVGSRTFSVKTGANEYGTTIDGFGRMK